MFRVVGISFDHMHMGDLLRQVHEHPDAEIAGIFDPDRSRMQPAIEAFAIPEDRVFTDLDACLATGADLAILCSATADHADMAERIAPSGMHLFVEKPFAASAADARRMIAAMAGTGKTHGDQLAAALGGVARHRQAADRRGRDRRTGRGAFLRRQPRAALPPGRQGRGHPRGGRAPEADLLVVPARRRRRQPARLSRLRRDARHLVHGRRGAARGDLHGRRDARDRGRPACDRRPVATRAGSPGWRPAGAPSPTPGPCSRSRNAASSSSAATARSPATTTRIT